MRKEESVTIKILKVFPNEKIFLQHSVLNQQIDLYFSEHKLAIEVDEKGHTDKHDADAEMQINPDAENYDIFVEIDKIKDYIAKSNDEAKTKEIKEKLEKEKEAEIKK